MRPPARQAPAHKPVMLQEAIDALCVRQEGFYVDCTFGGGGHSAAILRNLGPSGYLLAFDRDPESLEIAAGERFADPRFQLVRDCYSKFPSVLRRMRKIGQVHGILFDLGASSMQFDTPARGFSFRHDAPLDMRMDPGQELSACSWLNRAGEQEIADVLYRYGDERLARRIARGIVAQRDRRPITTTCQLGELVCGLYRKRRGRARAIHPATRTFLAIRIRVNQELEELQRALEAAPEALRVGGRLVTISFHSSEDRIVKRFVRASRRPGAPLPFLPAPGPPPAPRLRAVGRPRRPAAAECKANPRARSALLRVAERVLA